MLYLASEWKNKLRQYAPCSIVLTNGVKIPDVKKKVNLKQIVFLFLGNLGKEKGVFDLVKAVKKSRKNGFKGVVQIAGKEIENGDKAKLESYIRELELSDQVHLLGEIGGQEKERILGRIRLSCSAKPWRRATYGDTGRHGIFNAGFGDKRRSHTGGHYPWSGGLSF